MSKNMKYNKFFKANVLIFLFIGLLCGCSKTQNDPQVTQFDSEVRTSEGRVYVEWKAKNYPYYYELGKLNIGFVPFLGNCPLSVSTEMELVQKDGNWYTSSRDTEKRFLYSLSDLGNIVYADQTLTESDFEWNGNMNEIDEIRVLYQDKETVIFDKGEMKQIWQFLNDFSSYNDPETYGNVNSIDIYAVSGKLGGCLHLNDSITLICKDQTCFAYSSELGQKSVPNHIFEMLVQ